MPNPVGWQIGPIRLFAADFRAPGLHDGRFPLWKGRPDQHITGRIPLQPPCQHVQISAAAILDPSVPIAMKCSRKPVTSRSMP